MSVVATGHIIPYNLSIRGLWSLLALSCPAGTRPGLLRNETRSAGCQLSPRSDCGVTTRIRNSNRRSIRALAGSERRQTVPKGQNHSITVDSSQARRVFLSEDSFPRSGHHASLFRPGEVQRSGAGGRADLQSAGGEQGSEGELQRRVAECQSEDATSGQVSPHR